MVQVSAVQQCRFRPNFDYNVCVFCING